MIKESPHTITAATIVRAYVFGDRYAVKRIEAWGEANRAFLRSLIATPAKKK